MEERTAKASLVCLLRDPDGSEAYAQALEAAGFRVRAVPVLRFRFVNQDRLRASLEEAGAYGGLILTSPRAVAALTAVLDAAAGEAWREKPVFTVGPRTAAAARRLGFSPDGEAAGTAEALADVITQRAFEAPLLFLCGNRRRDALPNRLRAYGTTFREVCVYETHLRRDLDPAALAEARWLVFFSPSGVEAVQQMPGVDLRGVRKAAIGPTTAAALAAAGWTVDAVAASPTPDALAAAMRATPRTPQ